MGTISLRYKVAAWSSSQSLRLPSTWQTRLTLGANPQNKQMGEHTSGGGTGERRRDKQLPWMVQAAKKADRESCSCSRQG